MKRDEKWGWKLAWAGIGLIIVSCLLMFVAFSQEMLGLNKPLYYTIFVALVVMDLALVYSLVRKFFEKKK